MILSSIFQQQFLSQNNNRETSTLQLLPSVAAAWAFTENQNCLDTHHSTWNSAPVYDLFIAAIILTLCITLPEIHSISCRNLFHFHNGTEGQETQSLLNPGNNKMKIIMLQKNRVFFEVLH